MSETKPNISTPLDVGTEGRRSANQTWITSKSIAIAARIPHNLYNQIEAYGMTHFAKGEDKYDKTATIIDLITKGLGLDSVSQSVQQSVNQKDLEQLVQQTVTQELEKTVNQNDIQNVKQELLEFVKQLVQQSVNQYPQSLEQAISYHPTIQEMKTHIDSLDHYLDGLTQAIKDRTEIKTDNQPIEPVIDNVEEEEGDALEDLGDRSDLEVLGEAVDLPHEETEKDSSLCTDEDIKKAISKVRKLTVTQLQQIMKRFNSLKGKTVFSSRDYSQSRKRRKTDLIIDVLTREKDSQILMIQAIQETLNS